MGPTQFSIDVTHITDSLLNTSSQAYQHLINTQQNLMIIYAVKDFYEGVHQMLSPLQKVSA